MCAYGFVSLFFGSICLCLPSDISLSFSTPRSQVCVCIHAASGFCLYSNKTRQTSEKLWVIPAGGGRVLRRRCLVPAGGEAILLCLWSTVSFLLVTLSVLSFLWFRRSLSMGSTGLYMVLELRGLRSGSGPVLNHCRRCYLCCFMDITHLWQF